MNNEKMISELYHGNIAPATKSVVNGSEYQKCQYAFCDAIDELEKLLNENEKQLLEKLTDAWNRLNSIGGEECFTEGFKLGARIALEIFEKDDGQLKPITD